MAEVIRYGQDTNGRPIYMTRYMARWWERVCEELEFSPTIVQGAFMVRAGGGAAASAGYHDGGGCLDLRTWDRSLAQQQAMVRVLRSLGAAAWIRDATHGGMDPHLHFVLGSDAELSSGARWQWQAYLTGRDGLSGNGPDYHPRPNPIVTTPPEDEMADYAKQLDRIEKQNEAILARLGKDAVIRTRLAALVKQGKADARELAELRDLVEADAPTKKS